MSHILLFLSLLALSHATSFTGIATGAIDLSVLCCCCQNAKLDSCIFCTYGLAESACSSTNANSKWARSITEITNKMSPVKSHLRPSNTYTYLEDSSCWFTNTPTSTCTINPTSLVYQGSEFLLSSHCLARSPSCPLGPSCPNTIITDTYCLSRCGLSYPTSYCGAASDFTCTPSGHRLIGRKLVEYFFYFDKCSSTNVTDTGSSLIISTRDTTNSFDFIKRLSTQTIIPMYRNFDHGVYVYCTLDPFFISLADGRTHFWWSNVLVVIRGACTYYVPFDDEYDICVDDLFFSNYTFGCQDSLRAKTTFLSPITITLPLPPATSDSNSSSGLSCDTLNSQFDCAYKNWIDYYINSVSGSSAHVNYEDYLERQNHLASERAATSRSSWWDWLTAPGFSLFWSIGEKAFINVIEPFFLALIEAISDIVLEILNTFVDLFKRSQSFIDKLVDIITQILDVLFSLFALILKIILGVVIRFEQHFLLFEYIVVFLLINSKILNNNIFSLVIVFLLMIVFGIDRNSPSILLAFYNLQYSYVNFTGYESERFTFDYTITFHNPFTGIDYTLNIGPPNLQIGEIGLYDTKPSPSRNFTLFPVSNTTITCSQFPMYNITN